ncbi:MAG: AI-2E family transporter [bacterium]|nr:AI-2E family transporter [bacterium]
MEKVTFEFSWETIFKIGFLAVSIYILYQVKEILIWVLFALVISLLFNPLIEYLQGKKVPRTIAAVIVYSLVFGVFAVSIYIFAPLMIVEVHHFSEGFPEYFEKISPSLRGLGVAGFENFENFIDLAERTLSRVAENIFSALFSIFGGIFTTIFIISLGFFLSLEERAFEKSFSLFFPAEFENVALDLWKRCQKRVSGWFLTRVASSLFVGVLTYIALLVLGANYPFSFGILAFLSNFIPFVGPFIIGIFIFVLLVLTSPVKAVLAIIIFILIQQIEGSILTPVLSKKFIGLSPSLVLISLAVGGVLGGMWGAILGIPLLGILLEFLRDFLKKKKEFSS